MSRYVAALVYRKRIGSMARKAILAYCAERANDDGSGVWASKVRIAKEVECSKKTVISTMNEFVTEGILSEVGKRKCPNGYVIEYALNLAGIEALEDALTLDETRGADLHPSPEFTPRGEVSSPQEVKSVHPNRPKTVLKPSNNAGSDEPELFPDLHGKEEPKPKSPDPIEVGFREFWHDIWPSHSRKKPKQACEALYRKTCEGKHKRASRQLSPSELNEAARRYIASFNGDFTYLVSTQRFLNAPEWEPWLSDSKADRQIVHRPGDKPFWENYV
jgi:hypothetical protein